MSSLPSPDFFGVLCPLPDYPIHDTIVLHQQANQIFLVKLFQQPIKTFRFPKASGFSRKLNALEATSLGRSPKKVYLKSLIEIVPNLQKKEEKRLEGTLAWHLTSSPPAGLSF